ncbi:hypothetical protein IGI37_000982 [Enterococcus sp. AZ194]|uniref:alpha/beta hydrolase n=1 Tax=Enterococcus sp. AZ194 TaxID=2774629 RepID=UPI003F2683EE
MSKVILYIHGKGGHASEAENYKEAFSGFDIVGFDYDEYLPWIIEGNIKGFYDELKSQYDCVYVLANSIGAYLAMYALQNKNVERAFFISPILDMGRLITDMMDWANITEFKLHEKKEIITDFGEVLSWDYLQFTRENPLDWLVQTEILYAEKDHLTSPKTIAQFVAEHKNARVTTMTNGEHWFHTEEQLRFLNDWLKEVV